MLLGLILVSLFIWIAETPATFANAWTYPNHRKGLQGVPFEKRGAWYLLMILSLVLATLVRKPEAVGKTPTANRVQAASRMASTSAMFNPLK